MLTHANHLQAITDCIPIYSCLILFVCNYKGHVKLLFRSINQVSETAPYTEIANTETTIPTEWICEC